MVAALTDEPPINTWNKTAFEWYLLAMGLTTDPESERNPALALFVEIAQKYGKRLNASDLLYIEHPLARGIRRQICSRYSWAIPDPRALRLIASYSPLVEIGAGAGYWASLLAQEGADIAAYDLHPIKPRHKNQFVASDATSFFPVKYGGVPQLRPRREGRTLFLCWPYGNYMATRALRRYRGNRVVYVGEGGGGCCAEDDFFHALERDWKEVYCQDIPQWDGMSDYLWVYERDSCLAQEQPIANSSSRSSLSVS